LAGQVALVTGAGRGIGRAIAVELGTRGAAVAALARTAEDIGAVVSEMGDLGTRGLALPCDVTDDHAIASAVESAFDEWGRIDILVNCAGVVSLTNVFETTPKRLDLLWRVNARAPFVLAQLVLPAMVEQGSGHIVNIGALSSQWRGTTIPVGFAGYTATKAALVRLSHAIALDVHPFGVAVNVVAPSGFVTTGGWQAASGATTVLPNQEPPQYTARAVAWVVEQDPFTFTGRFVESQQVMASLNELDHEPIGWDKLRTVDTSALGAADG